MLSGVQPFWPLHQKKLVVRLCLDTHGPYLFGEAVCWVKHNKVFYPEELDRSCGLAATPFAVQVTQSVVGQRVIVTRRC